MFFPCPVLIRIHAQQNRARRPWLALIFYFQKNIKTHTPAHGGVFAHNQIRDKNLIHNLCNCSVETTPCTGCENKLAATQVRHEWGEAGMPSLCVEAGGRIAQPYWVQSICFEWFASAECLFLWWLSFLDKQKESHSPQAQSAGRNWVVKKEKILTFIHHLAKLIKVRPHLFFNVIFCSNHGFH